VVWTLSSICRVRPGGSEILANGTAMACFQPPHSVPHMGEEMFRLRFIGNPLNGRAAVTAHDVIAWSVGLRRERRLHPQEPSTC